MWSSLHGHTLYSDGLYSPQEILACAAEAGLHSIAVTDHGTMAGTYLSRCSSGEHTDRVKVIAGCEIYHNVGDERYHLTLLAANDDGFKSLCAANLHAWKNFYRFPIVSYEYLTNKSNWNGVICLTGCPSSRFAKLINVGDYSGAADWLRMLMSLFGSVYIEVQGGSEVQDSYAEGAMRLSREMKIKPVATSDYHYLRSNDANVHSALMLAKNKLPIPVDLSLLRRPETLAGKEGIDNAIDIANSVSYSKIGIQKISTGVTAETLKELAYAEIRRRKLPSEYYRQVDYEIDVMSKTDAIWYIGVLWQICNEMRRSGIMYEVRGSAASSLLLYLIGVVHFDPMRRNLLFDRFMSVSRREMPDVDIDVPASQRGDAIECIRSMGFNVTKIITSNALDERGAKRAAERAKKRGLDIEPDKLIGKTYNTGVHASGIVVYSGDCLVPIRYCNGDYVVEYENKYLPYVKFDILGQKTLDVIHHVEVRELSGNHQRALEIANDRLALYRSLCFAQRFGTPGIFQVEGSMSTMFTRFQCRSIDDLAKLISVYRPAVLQSGFAKKILDGERCDEELAKYCVSGYPIYQEDLMRILVGFGVCNISDAYTIVKLAAKKDNNALNSITDKVSQAIADEKRRNEILSILSAFFGYGFNMSHAMSYAIRAAVTSVLRYMYPKAFWESMFRFENDRIATVAYLVYLSQFYDIIPPESNCDCEINSNCVRVGLSMFKRINRETAETVCRIIYSKPSMHSLIRELILSKVNRSVIQMLSECLFMYWYGVSGKYGLDVYDAILYNMIRKKKRMDVPPDVGFNPNHHRYGNVEDNCGLFEMSGVPFIIPRGFIHEKRTGSICDGKIFIVTRGEDAFAILSGGRIYKVVGRKDNNLSGVRVISCKYKTQGARIYLYDEESEDYWIPF